MTTPKKFQPLIAAALLLAGGAANAATPFDTLGPFVQYRLNGAALQADFSGAWVTVNGSAANGSGGITGLGAAGVSKIGVGSTGSYSADAWSGWNDRVTITPTNSNQVGQTAKLQFQLRYDWSAVVAGSATGSAFLDVNFFPSAGGGSNQYMSLYEDIAQSCTTPGNCGAGGIQAFGPNASQVPTFANGVGTFNVNVVLGQTYTFVIGLNATSTSTAGSSISIDGTHSASWAGITSLSLAGAPVAYTIASNSGFDYTQPAAVPEASTAALLLAGLGVLAARRRTVPASS